MTQINSRKKAPQYDLPDLPGKQKAQKCPQISLYRGRYVAPTKIPGTRPDREHKVIYCVATLNPQITQIDAD